MLTVTVVVITWNRPTYVETCLTHIDALDTLPHQVIVVDASVDSVTRDVVSRHPTSEYVHFPRGAGHMTSSRNEALKRSTGDVVAFLDDDANVRPSWLQHLVQAYAAPDIGAVCGRTLNNQPGEAKQGADQVGRLLPNGELTGNFAADTGVVVDIDHGIGANMSFRRHVLAQLGGFRDWFPGTALREDADLFLRIRALGYRRAYTPFAVAEHTAAPHVKGNRFDFRYVFWGNHNHLLLLAMNYGLLSTITSRWIGVALFRALRMQGRSVPRRVFRALVAVAGLLCGLVSAARRHAFRALPPTRDDGLGQSVRHALLQHHP